MARTAVSAVSSEVSITTWVGIPSSMTSPRISMPLRPGRLTSSIVTSGRKDRILSTTPSGSVSPSTSYPSFRSARDSIDTISSSSSSRNTFPFASRLPLLRGNRG